MTLLIAPHPSSSSLVSRTQDKPFSPHSRRSGAKNNLKDTPPPPFYLTWHIVFKIHVVLSLVFITQRPRHLYLIAPQTPFRLRILKVNPPDAGTQSLSSSKKKCRPVKKKNKNIFFSHFIFPPLNLGLSPHEYKIIKTFFFSTDLYPGLPVWKIRKTKMEHTCPDCDVWSVAMTMHPIISPTTS